MLFLRQEGRERRRRRRRRRRQGGRNKVAGAG